MEFDTINKRLSISRASIGYIPNWLQLSLGSSGSRIPLKLETLSQERHMYIHVYTCTVFYIKCQGTHKTLKPAGTPVNECLGN